MAKLSCKSLVLAVTEGHTHTLSGARQNCSNIPRHHRPCATCSECCKGRTVSSVSKTRWRSPTACPSWRNNSSAQSEPCMQTLLLAGALDCKAESNPGRASDARCSAVQSMAPAWVLISLKKTPKTTKDKGPSNTQPKTKRHPRTEANRNTEGEGGAAKDQMDSVAPRETKRIQHEGSRPKHRQSGTQRKTQTKDREKPKENAQPKKPQQPKQAEGAERGGQNQKHRHRNNPHKEGDREPGGSRGQRESGHKRTRVGS